MVKHKDTLLSASLFAFCGYQLVSSMINGQNTPPVENPALLYPWFSENTANLSAIDLLSTLVKNSLPFAQDLLKDILIGIAAGVIQCPLAIGAFLMQNNVPLNKVSLAFLKKQKTLTR